MAIYQNATVDRDRQRAERMGDTRYRLGKLRNQASVTDCGVQATIGGWTPRLSSPTST